MVAWSGWFIWRTSFVFAGRRVFCLFEDAMVAMTYARNLVEGHGLNWARAGAPVEGFTSPLWTALLIPVNALPLALRYRGLLVQLLSLAILVANVLLVRRLTLRFFSTRGARHWMPAALLTAFYYPLNHWALFGMESGLQALLTTASVLLALDIVHRGQDRHRELLLLGAAACLLRSDMLPIVAAIQVYVLAKGGLHERRQRVHWGQGLAGLALAVAGYSAFRWLYFKDALSNTYYLELYRIPLEPRLMRGVFLLGTMISEHLLVLAAVGIGLALLARYRHDADGLASRMALPASLFLIACAFSVYRGGDAGNLDLRLRANRFVVYVMPLVFVLFNALINQVAGWIAARQPDDDLARRFFVTLATVLALTVADGLWLTADVGGNWMALLAALPPPEVKGEAEIYARLRKLQGWLGPSGIVATSTAGIPAYFSDYQMIDLLGGNERHIARLPPSVPLRPEDFMEYAPGRVKSDDPYVLERYHPDAILDSGPGDRSRRLAAVGYRHVAEGDFWLLEKRAAKGL
jgi:hypothetical protein